MDNAKELFVKYKALTIQIGKLIEEEKIEELDKFIELRQKVIEAIANSSIDKQRGASYIKELSIEEEDKRVYKLMEEKKESIYKDIKKIQKTSKINNEYGGFNSGFNSSGYHFSKKI